MNHGDERNEETLTRRKRKRRLFLLKICLALLILFVILWNVKVRDHLTLPEGGPCAGTHAGWIEHDDLTTPNHVLFICQDPEFQFEALLEKGNILSGTLTPGGGEALALDAAAIKDTLLREGVASVVKKIKVGFWCLAILIYFVAISITAIRWGILLKAANLPQHLGRAYRLTFIGVFFNNVVPGQTGGDLVRAFYIARENKGNRTDSVLSVIVDRVLGITALACIAAVIIPTNPEQFGEVGKYIYGFVGILVVGAVIFFSKRIRRFFKLDKLLRKLPYQEFFQKIDRSIFLYRYRMKTVVICFLMSFVVHMTIISSIWVLGMGLEIELSLITYMAYIPMIFILSSIPITPGAWGVGELLFVFFFATWGGLPAAQPMAISLFFRLNTAIVSLLGGAFLLMERDRVKPGDIELDHEESEKIVDS